MSTSASSPGRAWGIKSVYPETRAIPLPSEESEDIFTLYVSFLFTGIIKINPFERFSVLYTKNVTVATVVNKMFTKYTKFVN